MYASSMIPFLFCIGMSSAVGTNDEHPVDLFHSLDNMRSQSAPAAFLYELNQQKCTVTGTEL